MRRNTRWLAGAGAVWLVLGCSAADRDWIEDIFDGRGHGHSGGGHAGADGGPGEPQPVPCGGRTTIGMDDVYQEIATDLARIDDADRGFARYFSLASEANVLGCGAALDTPRQALFELVNSLSLGTVLTLPAAVDADETLYRVDIRDYDWDRSVEVGGSAFADVWEALISSSIYAVEFVGDDADDARSDSGTSVPVLPVSAFVAAATSANVYYGVLGIPEDLDAFLVDDLAIDAAANLQDRALVRAGLDGTGFAGTEFLLERFDIQVRAGYVWQIFADPEGGEALLEDPLGTPDHQERELLFTLPNGLLAHALADGNGQRIDASDQLIDGNELDFRAKVAISYLRLRSQGMTGSDSLRAAVLADPSGLSPEELEAILEIYPTADALADQLEFDRDFPGTALAALGGDIDAPDPSAAVFDRFASTLDLEAAAADLFVSPEFLEDNLNLLAPELGVLDGGNIDRADFDVFYLDSLCILSVVNENTPDPLLCE